jgi:uncharacterized membrane protein YraQ (UPF0718 family)
MIVEQVDNGRNETVLTGRQRVFYFVLPTLVIVAALIAYKSSAALTVIGRVSATGVFTPRGSVIPRVGASEVGVLTRTLNYFLIIWPALLFGILISGAVRTFVSPHWLNRLFSKRSLRSQAIAGLAGAPLMLCSCCVAPVFKGVYERSGRLGPSLALMLAAPALNPAALILTFMLFDYKIGVVRLGASLAAVLFTGMIADSIFGGTKISCDIDNWQAQAQPSDFYRFLRVSSSVALRVVPLITVGVLVSMLIAEIMPVHIFDSSVAKFALIATVATFAVPLALPTFFEIPLALILLSSGAPAGAAVALLIAGPSVNLPSLLTIMRSTSWKIAALVAVSIWILAVAGGLLISFF